MNSTWTHTNLSINVDQRTGRFPLKGMKDVYDIFTRSNLKNWLCPNFWIPLVNHCAGCHLFKTDFNWFPALQVESWAHIPKGKSCLDFQEAGGRNGRFLSRKAYKPVTESSLTTQDGNRERQHFWTPLVPSCRWQTFMSHFLASVESQQGVQKCQMLIKYVSF